MLKRLKGHTFLRNVTLIAGSSSLGQAILLAATPILTRLYDPKDFGVLSVYVSILTVMGAASCLHFDRAIPLAIEIRKALGLAVLSFLILTCVTLFSSIIFLTFSHEIADLMNESRIEKLLWLIPVGVFLLGIYNILNFLAVKEQFYKAIAKSKVSQSFCAVVFQIALGFLSFGPLGLITGHVISQSVGSTLLFRNLKYMFEGALSFSKNELKELFIHHKDFPTYSAPQNVMNALGQNIPSILLTKYFGIEVSGFYMLAKQSLQKPMSLISESFRQVFYKKAIDSQLEKNLHQVILKGTFALALIGFVPLCLIFWGGPVLFKFVFGTGWGQAGEFASWMMIWVYFGFINTPSAVAIPVLKLQKLFFFYEFVFTIARCVTLVLGGMYLGALETMIVFSVVSAVFNLGLVCYVLIKSKKQ